MNPPATHAEPTPRAPDNAPRKTKKPSIVVLCSGRGSNLQALIDASHAGTLAAAIVGVCSDKPQCTALERARSAGIATRAIRARDFATRADFDRALFAQVASLQPDLVVLAGYMRIIDPAVVDAWQGRMINIHPSLLPKYPGLHTHQRALDAGDDTHGSSVHFVTGELDGGPLIAQAVVPIERADTAETLATRLLPLEHRLLVAVTQAVAGGAIALRDGRVQHDGRPLAAPLHLAANDELV